MKLKTVLYGFLFLLTTDVFAITLEEAVELEKTGKTDEAKKAYNELLDDGVNQCEVIERLVGITAGLLEKKEYLQKGLELCQAPEARHRFYVLLAQIEEITGNLESAQRNYQSASLSIPEKKDFESLIASANLLNEIGNYRGAEAQAKVIIDTCRDTNIRQNARVLLSRVYFATERENLAIGIVQELIREEPEDLGPGELFWIIEIAGYEGKDKLSSDAGKLLLSKYPGSPEAHILNGAVDRLPSISLFIGPEETEMDQVKEPEIETAKTEALAVQTGSYSVRENAEFALKDLEAEGFKAVVRERKVGDTVYYRVLIPDIDANSVENIILELKEKGFEGFRVYE